MEDDIDLREMLTLQLSEVEMLGSMYPNTGEFELDDPLSMHDVQEFIDDKLTYESLTSRIGFLLKLDVESENAKKHLEVVCNFSHEYPAIPPEIYLRANWLSRNNHRILSDELQDFILQLDRGEICMCYVIEWLNENATKYMVNEEADTHEQKCPPKKETTFTRMWIYSHHIYSKWKRSDILNFSKELNLTGFCMPGKPGIICIEGYRSSVEEFWYRIRRMNWKRLVMKEREDKFLGDQDVDTFRSFGPVEERSFEARLSKGRGAHGDRGLLYQFMDEHGCGHIFPMYFGVEGKCAEPDSD